MKSPSLFLIEHHPPRTDPPDQIIHQAIALWLAKELSVGVCAVEEV